MRVQLFNMAVVCLLVGLVLARPGRGANINDETELSTAIGAFNANTDSTFDIQSNFALSADRPLLNPATDGRTLTVNGGNRTITANTFSPLKFQVGGNRVVGFVGQDLSIVGGPTVNGQPRGVQFIGANSKIGFSANSAFSSNLFFNSTFITLQTAASFGAASNDVAFGSNGVLVNPLLSMTVPHNLSIAGQAFFAAPAGVVANFTGTLSGPGSVIVQGLEIFPQNGTIILSGANTYTGGTTVANGTLLINGSVLGTATANVTGTLGGSGTIAGNVTLNGAQARINPGAALNTIGTLTTAGAFNATAGTLLVDFNGAAADLLVANTATINANASVLVNDISSGAPLTRGQRFTYLQTTGGLTGRFGSMTDNLPMIDLEFGFDATSAFFVVPALPAEPEPAPEPAAPPVVIAPPAPRFVDFALTPNQRSVALTLDAARPGATGDFQLVIENSLVLLNLGQLQNSYNALAGEVYGGVSRSLTTDFGIDFRGVERRLWSRSRAEPKTAAQAGSPAWSPFSLAAPLSAAPALMEGPGAAPTPFAPVPGWKEWSGWARAQGYDTDLDADGNAASVSTRSRGASFGADHDWNGRGTYGFTAAYSDSDVQVASQAQRIEVDSYRVGAYAQRLFADRWYANGIASAGVFDLQSRRAIILPNLVRDTRADFDADGFSTYLEIGKLLTSRGLQIRPHVSLQYAHVDQERFTESGAGSLDLTVNRIETDSLLPGVGVWLSRPCTTSKGMLVTPELRLRYQHELENNSGTAVASFAGAPGLPFTVTAARQSDDYLLAGLGVTARLDDRLSVFGSYDGQFSNSTDTHYGELGARFAW